MKFGLNVNCTMLLVPIWSISLGGHDPGSLTLVLGHQKKSVDKSCVSFGEECITAQVIIYAYVYLKVFPYIYSERQNNHKVSWQSV